MDRPSPRPPSVDRQRLLSRLRTLAAIGRDQDGGITRPGFSQAADEANAFVSAEARRAGLDARIDAGGNLLITRRGAHGPTLLLGSHLDTVVHGGRLDGAYGVIAALEVLETFTQREIDLATDVAAVAFANEEGALFPQPFWGSMVLAGMLDALPREPTDYHGNPLGPALARTGGNLTDLPAAIWPAHSLAGYIELHIEQGPVLESEGIQVGVVDAIVGRTVLQVDLHGVAAHAGTTPMDARQDPLIAAAQLTLFVQALPGSGQCQVATVGRLEVTPNSANTIPGRVRMTVDLRERRPEQLERAEAQVRAEVDALAARHRIETRCERTIASRPAAMDSALRKAICASADSLGLSYRTLSSGAGHDAQIMATVTPTAMIFAPSIGGVSHVPQEDTSDDDLVSGAELLLHAAHRLAAR